MSYLRGGIVQLHRRGEPSPPQLAEAADAVKCQLERFEFHLFKRFENVVGIAVLADEREREVQIFGLGVVSADIGAL